MTENNTPAPIFLPTEAYHRLVKELVEVKPDPFTGEIEPCAIKIALGEHGAIFPDWLQAHDDPGDNSPALEAARSISSGLVQLTARNLPSDFLDGYADDMGAMAARSIS